MLSRPRQWFAKDPAFDALLQQRFQGLTRRAIAGELDPWSTETAGGLALALSRKAVERGWWEAEPEQARRQFWLMPLMHSEDLAVQETALPPLKQLSAQQGKEAAATGGHRLPAMLALLGPEADRLLARQLPARFQQRRLTAGHHLPEDQLLALTPALVTPWPEVQHLAAVAQPQATSRHSTSTPARWPPWIRTQPAGSGSWPAMSHPAY